MNNEHENNVIALPSGWDWVDLNEVRKPIPHTDLVLSLAPVYTGRGVWKTNVFHVILIKEEVDGEEVDVADCLVKTKDTCQGIEYERGCKGAEIAFMSNRMRDTSDVTQLQPIPVVEVED